MVGEMYDSADQEVRRRNKFAAKRFNEHVKLLASFLNALALGVIGAGLIIPTVSGGIGLLTTDSVIWILIGLALHLGAHIVLLRLKNEEL